MKEKSQPISEEPDLPKMVFDITDFYAQKTGLEVTEEQLLKKETEPLEKPTQPNKQEQTSQGVKGE